MNNEQEKNIRIEVNKHITLIREARIRESGKRASAYLYITSGALVLSVSLLSTTGLEYLDNPSILALSWIMLLISIITQLVSYNLTDLGFNKNEKDVNEWFKKSMNLSTIPDDVNVWIKLVRVVNYISSLFTVSGLVLLVIFGIINII